MVVSEKCGFNSIKNRDVFVLKMKCPFFGKSARESIHGSKLGFNPQNGDEPKMGMSQPSFG